MGNKGEFYLRKVIRKDFSEDVTFKLTLYWAMGWVGCSQQRKEHVQRACGQKDLDMLEELQRCSCG